MGSDAEDVIYTKNYEQMKIMIRDHLKAEPNNMTALEFLQSWDHLKEKLKPKKAKHGR